MLSSPITSWQIEGEKVEAVANFIFLISKITVDGHCSHEIKRLLRVPWTERRSNLSILKETNPEYSLEGQMLRLTILWPPDMRSPLIGKDPDAGKDGTQKKKGW